MPESRPSQFIDTQAGLEALVRRLETEPALALDTESNSFHVYFERVCLIQLSTRDADFAVDPFHIDARPLGTLFANPAIEIVVHAADYDVRSLKRDFDFHFARLFDTMLAAKMLKKPEIGLAALVKGSFGIRLAKEHQRSDWGRRPLSAAQLAYAHMDTRYLLPLRDLLGHEIATAGREAEARTLFDRQAACEPRPRRWDAEAFRRIRGFRALEPSERAVVGALYQLREDCARAANRPPFKVFGDDALFELAKRRPRSSEELAHVKGVGSSTVRRDGEAIVAAIARALASDAAHAA
jgi:ribonuclease D